MKQIKLILTLVFTSAFGCVFSQAPTKSFTEKLDGIQASGNELTKNAATDNSSVGQSGNMNTSVPLITINSRTMSFPLQLNYSAGIKVDQQSGPVGLGWAMPVGSIVRDYGAFEPDYSSTDHEASMNSSGGGNDGWLNPNGANIDLSPTNQSLDYDAINVAASTIPLSDMYRMNVSGLGSNSFWNSANSNNHNWAWTEFENWKVEQSVKTYSVSQEFSRINELNIGAIAGGHADLTKFNRDGSLASGIGMLPYVINGEAYKPSSNLPSASEQLVKYEDFEAFTVTDDNGVQYVFGRPLRGQKFVFSDDPYWSSKDATSTSANGSFWKIDFIAEWLLTEIRSVDYFDTNGNGIADDGDKGDWIRFEYTAPTKIEGTIHKGLTNSLLQQEVPMHRQWSSYSQTDQASSLMREIAYLSKVVTPVETIDLTISPRFDVDHDYYSKPANQSLGMYYYENRQYVSTGTAEDFDIHYPVETMKYDAIEVTSRLMDGNIYEGENLRTKKIVLKYAKKGGKNELAVSDYLIRDNNNDQIPGTDNPSTTSDFNIEKYNGVDKRGKTTLLGIDFYDGELNANTVSSYSFDYAYNPSFNEAHKRAIVRKYSTPSLRTANSSKLYPKSTSLINYNESVLSNSGSSTSTVVHSGTNNTLHPSEFTIDFPYNEVYYKLDILDAQIPNYVASGYTDAQSYSILSESIVHPLTPIKDVYGYLYADNCTDCPKAWSLTSITYPTGGKIAFEYEQGEFDKVVDSPNWNIGENNIPIIKDYNDLAKRRSYVQDVYNRYVQLQGSSGIGINDKYKTLTAAFEVDLPKEYGIRLKKTVADDRINPTVTTSYKYGTGHFSSTPSEYVQSYVNSYSSFIVREKNRHSWELTHYGPYAPTSMTDYDERMSHTSISGLALDEYESIFFYERIDELNADNSKTRSHYGPMDGANIVEYDEYELFCSRLRGINWDGRYLLARSTLDLNPVTPLKTESFEAGQSQPYRTVENKYQRTKLQSKDLSFNYNINGTNPNNTLSLWGNINTYPIWVPITDDYQLSNVTFGNVTIWFFQSGASAYGTGEVGFGYLPYVNVVDELVLPYNGSTNYSYERWGSFKSTLTTSVTNYKGMISSTNYAYDSDYNLELKKEAANFTNEVYFTKYEYAHNTYSGATTEFEDHNLFKLPTSTTKYLGSTLDADALNASMVTYDYANFDTPRPNETYQFESDVDPISGKFNLTPYQVGGANSGWRVNESDFIEYNNQGALISGRTNRLFGKKVMGNNLYVPKADFNYPENSFDATYTGFEDLTGRHNVDDWNVESYKDEKWFTDYVEIENEPAYSMWFPTDPCGTLPSGALLDYNSQLNAITIDNLSGLSVGDIVEVELIGSSYTNPYPYTFQIETTISDILVRDDYWPDGTGVSTIQNNMKEFVLCFSDPIVFPESTVQAPFQPAGVMDGTAFTTIDQTIVTKKNPDYVLSRMYKRTGNFSYRVQSQRVEGEPLHKTPIRPVKIKNLVSESDCSNPNGPYEPSLPSDCFWTYEASLWLKLGYDRPPAFPVSEAIPSQTMDANGDAIYRRGAVTEVNNGSGIKIICDVWNYNRTTLIEQRVFYPVNIHSAFQQFTVNVPVKKGSEKYLDVYVVNERVQLLTEVAWKLLSSVFVDDICIYPKGAKYSYSTVNKFGEKTFTVNDNDVFSEVVYDESGRATSQKNDYGSTVAQMKYFTNPNWIIEMNHVTNRTWIDNGSYSETRQYIDGFGKTKQVMVSDVNRDARIVSETNSFNNKGQLIRSYKPYALSNANFLGRYDSDFDVKTQNLYGSYSAYTDLAYEPLPEDKLSTIKPPRLNTEAVISSSQKDYASIAPITHPYMPTNNVFAIGELLVHEVTDASENITWTYMDNLGRVIMEKHEIGNEYEQNSDGSISDLGVGYTTAETWFVYDGAGRITKVVDPSGKESTYKYNSLGLVVKKDQADKGVSEMRYDKYGQVRFTRNAKDVNVSTTNAYGTDQFNYLKYDVWGRPIESGLIKAADFDPTTLSTPFTGTQYFDNYSFIDNQDFPFATTQMNQLVQQYFYDESREMFANNALLKDYAYSDHVMNLNNGLWTAGKTDVKLFTYMADAQIGRIKYIYDGLNTEHTFEPQYNVLRMPIGKKYIHPTNSLFNFEWGIEMDDFGRIQSNNTTHNGVTTENDKNYYDVLGNLLMTGIGATGNQLDPHVDYHTSKWDIRDQLTHYVSKNFRFGLQYNENGNIADQYWSSSEFDDNTSSIQVNQYEYYYDQMDRLTGADYKMANTPLTTFDYYNSISTSLPDDFYCGVNAAVMRESLEPIQTELTLNIQKRIKTQLSNDALNALNILKAVYIENNIQYQNMSRAEKSVFFETYITEVNGVRGSVLAYEQYEAEKDGNKGHLNLIGGLKEPLPKHLVYLKSFLSTISYDPETINCDPNPNATVYGYLPEFPFPEGMTNVTKYDVATWYSKNGNITSLNRNDNALPNSVKVQQYYDYGNTGDNQLSSVKWYNDGVFDHSEGYNYDAVGNLLDDSQNGVSNIEYHDYNDMPKSITNAFGTASYRYDGEQSRAVKEITGNDIEYYFEGVIVNQDGLVVSYQTSNGFAEPSGNTVYHYYNLTDWLGTNRGVMDANGVVQNATDHYPFGKRMPGRNVYASNDGGRYQYTGHEFDGETGYGYHGARYYNRELGKYMTVDPLAESYFGWSSYNYTMGNPVNMIDPTGEGPTDWVKTKDGEYIWDNTVHSEAQTHEGQTYIGPNDEDIVKDLFGATEKETETVQSVSYAASHDTHGPTQMSTSKGAGITTYLMVNIKADVTRADENSTPVFNGITINASAQGLTNAALLPYEDFEFSTTSATINGTKMTKKTYPAGGIGPEAWSGGYFYKFSAKRIARDYNSSKKLTVRIQGGYSIGGAPVKWPLSAGAAIRSTNVSTNIYYNND